MMEIWRDIPGRGGLYEASTLGRIRRSPTSLPLGNVIPGRILRLKVARNGYVRASLCIRGRNVTAVVHRLVAAAFLGECPAGYQVNHRDGVKTNNRPENLEYCSQRENMRHCVATGLYPSGDRNGSRTRPESRPRGERHHWAKLTAAQVAEIRAARAAGATLTALAKRYGVSSPQTILYICTGATWAT
jgi:hypothetical protein